MVYNSVDFSRVAKAHVSREEFCRKYEIPVSCRVVSQVSWMIPEKGVADLLHAMRLVLQHEQEVQLVLVGEGKHRPEFESLSRELGIAEHVTFTGSLEDPIAEGVFLASDIVCQLSRWQEVFGYVIAEALAFSKPIVASNIGGIPELVHDGINGFLVSPGDTTLAAERILQLLRDDGLRKDMGKMGLDLARANFDLKTNVGKLIQMYALAPAHA